MSSFPGPDSEFCKNLFKETKTSLYELAEKLEIHSISQILSIKLETVGPNACSCANACLYTRCRDLNDEKLGHMITRR